MYFIPSLKQLVANSITAAATLTGGPIQILGLPYPVTALPNQPRDFNFTTINDTSPLPANALCFVETAKTLNDRKTFTRLRNQTLDPTTLVATGNYINNPATGKIEVSLVVSVMVQLVGSNPLVDAKWRDYLACGVATTFMTMAAGLAMSDGVTGENYTIHELGERCEIITLPDEKLKNQRLILYSAVVNMNTLISFQG